jgi:putative tricarboxylic transport membrane protein
MRTRELPPILFFLLLGLYVSWASRGLGLGSLYQPGPGLMPFYLGLGLVLLSVAMLLRLFLQRPKEEEKVGKRPQAIDYPRIALVVTALVVYSLVIENLGYIPATLVLLVILFLCAGSKRTSAVIASIATLLITYFGFTYLGVRFPPGILTVFGLY